jgi:type 1 glutamine amidotransferase
MKDVPASFEVEDELYYVNAEPDKIPAGTAPITVLAQTSPSIKYKQSHPAVWVTQHDKARVIGLTLGHDQRVHDLPAYRTLLVNAVKWTAGK